MTDALRAQLARLEQWDWLSGYSDVAAARSLLEDLGRLDGPICAEHAQRALETEAALRGGLRADLFNYVPKNSATPLGPGRHGPGDTPSETVREVLAEAAAVIEQIADAADAIGPRHTDPAPGECLEWAESGVRAMSDMRHDILAAAAAGSDCDLAADDWTDSIDSLISRIPLRRAAVPSKPPKPHSLRQGGLWVTSSLRMQSVAWQSELCIYVLQSPGFLQAAVLDQGHLRSGRPEVSAMHAVYDSLGGLSNARRSGRREPLTSPAAIAKHAAAIESQHKLSAEAVSAGRARADRGDGIWL